MIRILDVKHKPVNLQAIEITDELISMLPIELNNGILLLKKDRVFIHTIDGRLEARVRDFILMGVKGEIYLIKRDIFFKTYDIIGGNDVTDLSESKKKINV